MRFCSDNTATTCPEILQALVAANEGFAQAYGSGGAHIVAVTGEQGKLSATRLTAALDANPPSVHAPQPAAVSLAQATEAGTAYRPAEIAALAQVAHSRGLKVHMDGARFANALVFLGCEPADLTWRVGVDVLSFGATKNGALGAEAVVFFDPALARAGSVETFELRRKRAGHLLSKSRYVAAQLLAYVESCVWRRNAARANSLAQELARHASRWLLYPVEANQLFLDLGRPAKQRLREQGFEFFDWGAAQSGVARFVVSWDQAAAEVAALSAALDRL